MSDFLTSHCSSDNLWVLKVSFKKTAFSSLWTTTHRFFSSFRACKFRFSTWHSATHPLEWPTTECSHVTNSPYVWMLALGRASADFHVAACNAISLSCYVPQYQFSSFRVCKSGFFPLVLHTHLNQLWLNVRTRGSQRRRYLTSCYERVSYVRDTNKYKETLKCPWHEKTSWSQKFSSL